MACLVNKLPWEFKRGASFDLTLRVPSEFADGHFAGWTLESKVRAPSGGFIAALTAEWVDPVVARFVHLQCLDTRAWSIGEAHFDVVFVSPGGFRWPSETSAFTVIKGPTDA